MVINIRHFIITIIAIFLSLGIGIFIGVIIDSQQLFIEQQKVLVSQIEEEFDGFKQKNYELMSKLEESKRDNERKDRFLDKVYYKLIKDSLTDKNVMVINMFTEDNSLNIKEILNEGGTKEIIEVILPRESKEYVKGMDKNKKEKFELEGNSKEQIHNKIDEKIISRIFMNDYNRLPFSLKKMGYFDYKGELYCTIDYVILIDDGFNINNKYYRTARIELINLINNYNIPLMVIEKSDIRPSSIALYKELGISSVDNVDTKLGKIAMLMVLKGKEGHYGEKTTADKLLPEDFFIFDVN